MTAKQRRRNPPGVRGGKWDWTKYGTDGTGLSYWRDDVQVQTLDDRGGSGELVLAVESYGGGHLNRDEVLHLVAFLSKWLQTVPEANHGAVEFKPGKRLSLHERARRGL